MEINKALIVYAKPKNKYEKLALNEVKNILSNSNISYISSNRDHLNKRLFKSQDLIIAVGGDGTFLRTSHFILDNTLIIGVNSDPRNKEGFFMVSDVKNFKSKFKKILNNKFKVRRHFRIEAFISNKKVSELALNEFYIASEKPYHTARYILKVKGGRERQKSSGVLVSTAAGTHSWIKSAGGKVLPLDSNKMEYLIREPYCGRVSAQCKLLNGILNKEEAVEIIFEMGNGILIADSLSKEQKFKAGQTVKINLSKKNLFSIVV